MTLINIILAEIGGFFVKLIYIWVKCRSFLAVEIDRRHSYFKTKITFIVLYQTVPFMGFSFDICIYLNIFKINMLLI